MVLLAKENIVIIVPVINNVYDLGLYMECLCEDNKHIMTGTLPVLQSLNTASDRKFGLQLTQLSNCNSFTFSHICNKQGKSLKLGNPSMYFYLQNQLKISPDMAAILLTWH